MASDRARYYIEQTIPSLQTYSRKKIFTPTEIRAIASKRSDFEHTLSSRGSKPTDYARYATYEANLATLVRKRCRRLAIKNPDLQKGSAVRTVFFILERGTKKFPGDVGLWLQLIGFCQEHDASKKLAKVFTSVLRLMPREQGLWILAAKHYAEREGDVRTARQYLQRGLRFCGDKVELWLEYVRLEMGWLAKIEGRRKILGLSEQEGDGAMQQDSEVGGNDDDDDENADMIALPAVTKEDFTVGDGEGDLQPNISEIERQQNISSKAIFNGAIPSTIFDSAMKQFASRRDVPEIAEQFFELVAEFNQVPATKSILEGITAHLLNYYGTSSEAVLCNTKLQLFGVDPVGAEFPRALGEALSRLKVGVENPGVQDGGKKEIAERAVMLLLPYFRYELDEDVVRVLEVKVRSYFRLLAPTTNERQVRLSEAIERLRAGGQEVEAKTLERISRYSTTAFTTHSRAVPDSDDDCFYDAFSDVSMELGEADRLQVNEEVSGLLKLPDEIILDIMKKILPSKMVFHFFPARPRHVRSRPVGTKVQKLRQGTFSETVTACYDDVMIIDYARVCKRFKEVCYTAFYGENHFILEIAATALECELSDQEKSKPRSAAGIDVRKRSDLILPFNYSPDLLWPFSTGIAGYLTELTILVRIDPSLSAPGRRTVKKRFDEAIMLFSGSENLHQLTIDVRRTHGLYSRLCRLSTRLVRLDQLPERLKWNHDGVGGPMVVLRDPTVVGVQSFVRRSLLESLGWLADVEYFMLSATDDDAQHGRTACEVLEALAPAQDG